MQRITPNELDERLRVEVEHARSVIEALMRRDCEGCASFALAYTRLVAHIVANQASARNAVKRLEDERAFLLRALERVYPEQIRVWRARHRNEAQSLETMSASKLGTYIAEWAKEAVQAASRAAFDLALADVEDERRRSDALKAGLDEARAVFERVERLRYMVPASVLGLDEEATDRFLAGDLSLLDLLWESIGKAGGTLVLGNEGRKVSLRRSGVGADEGVQGARAPRPAGGRGREQADGDPHGAPTQRQPASQLAPVVPLRDGDPHGARTQRPSSDEQRRPRDGRAGTGAPAPPKGAPVAPPRRDAAAAPGARVERAPDAPRQARAPEPSRTSAPSDTERRGGRSAPLSPSPPPPQHRAEPPSPPPSPPPAPAPGPSDGELERAGVEAMVRRGSWSRRLLTSDLEAVGLDADDVIAAMGRRSLVKGYPTKNGDALYLPDALWEAGVRSLFPDGDEGLATTAWGMAMHKVRHTEERQQVADALCPFLALGWRMAMVGIGGDTLWAQLALDEDAARSREVPYHSGLLAVCLGVGMSPPPFSVGPNDVGCVWVVGNDDASVHLSGLSLSRGISVWFVPRAASDNDAAWVLVRGRERRPLR